MPIERASAPHPAHRTSADTATSSDAPRPQRWYPSRQGGITDECPRDADDDVAPARGLAIAPIACIATKNVVVAAALTSIIMLVGFLHAPVMPGVGGAAIACAWTLWRVSGG